MGDTVGLQMIQDGAAFSATANHPDITRRRRNHLPQGGVLQHVVIQEVEAIGEQVSPITASCTSSRPQTLESW